MMLSNKTRRNLINNPTTGIMSETEDTCLMRYQMRQEFLEELKVIRKDERHKGTAEREDVLERFFAKVNKTSSCWNWINISRKGHGYGRFWWNGQGIQAHRFAYLLFISDIPNNLVIDHICRNKSCVNVNHLRLITNKENILIGNGAPAVNSRKTHCNRGHEFNFSNTHIDKKGRRCKACNFLNNRRSKARLRNNGEILIATAIKSEFNLEGDHD